MGTRFARVRWSPALVFGLLGVAAIFVVGNSVLGEIGLAFLALKLLLSAGARRNLPEAEDAPIAKLRVVVLVPMYNEDPEIIRRSIRSMLEQTRVPDRIHVVDDGSRSNDAVDAVKLERTGVETRVRISRHRMNLGKREALATAARAEQDADIFVTVDSDTILDPHAIEALLRAFRDRTVMGVTGFVRVLNRHRNVLTRLIDLRYANAFLLDRGFQSTFGSVLCACGSLAAWRRRVLIDNLNDFVRQRFLGQICTYGDDRRLTNYALSSGRVLLAREAIAYTAAPERLSHYVRQQARWCRSFVRESLWAVMNLPLSRPALWLSLAELTGWILFTLTAGFIVVMLPFIGMVFGLTAVAAYVTLTSAMAWVRSVRWFDAGVEGETRGDRVRTFLLAPIYAVLSLFVLLPLRFVALATLRTTSWGTRSDVEVTLESKQPTPESATARARRWREAQPARV
jgi:hyaluronan synthase